jgi:hypothetical protein
MVGMCMILTLAFLCF